MGGWADPLPDSRAPAGLQACIDCKTGANCCFLVPAAACPAAAAWRPVLPLLLLPLLLLLPGACCCNSCRCLPCCCFSCCCFSCCCFSCRGCRKREEAKHKAVALAPAIAKWLKASGAPDVALGGIAWAKVLQPNKKVSVYEAQLACPALLSWRPSAALWLLCLAETCLHSNAVLAATAALSFL